MPHHILIVHTCDADILYIAQNRYCLPQTGLLSIRQVNLRQVSGYDYLGVKSNTGQKHLHLRLRRILRLIQYDKRIIQCPSSHIGERRDLYYTPFQIFGNRFRSHHLIQSIIERTQIGIDLTLQVSRQKTQLFPGLNRGSCQDNPADLILLKSLVRPWP